MLSAMGVAVGAVSSVVALKQGKEYGEKGLNDGQKFHREAQEKTEGALFTPCFAWQVAAFGQRSRCTLRATRGSNGAVGLLSIDIDAHSSSTARLCLVSL